MSQAKEVCSKAAQRNPAVIRPGCAQIAAHQVMPREVWSGLERVAQ
jgi:hypothetical protein